MTSDWDRHPLELTRLGVVTPDLLEEGLARARAVAPSPLEGVFGPESLMWRRQREALTFFGAGRAMVLQTAHPWVAAAIAQQSTTMMRPLARFHRTFMIIFSMAFGSLDQAFEKARLFHAIHARIKGTMAESVGPFPAGSPYRADDIAAMVWVHATLIDTSIGMHEMILGPMEASEREAFYEESRRFAWLYGIPDEALPPDWARFERYFEAMLASGILSTGSEGRLVVNTLLRGKGERPRPRVPFSFYALTVDALPPSVRDIFDMPLGAREARVAARWRRRLQVWYPRLPRFLRDVPSYREAMGRIEGRKGPDLFTRTMNRLWVGRSTLVS